MSARNKRNKLPASKKCKKDELDGNARKLPRFQSYTDKNKDLPFYGVIVTWASDVKYNNRQLQEIFDAKLKNYRATSNPVKQNSSLKRKLMPFYRRTAPNKVMVIFESMLHANSFATETHSEFYAFIPLSFVSVLGVTVFDAPKINIKDLQSSPTNPVEILQYRKKKLSDSKIQVTVAIRGSKLPETLNYKDGTKPLHLHERSPVYCPRCLRYGHRRPDCMHKPRCGKCVRTKPALHHQENKCRVVKKLKEHSCIFCEGNHTIGDSNCVEHSEQRLFKMQLVKNNMDFVSTLESEIIPSIRSTAVNSNWKWLDC